MRPNTSDKKRRKRISEISNLLAIRGWAEGAHYTTLVYMIQELIAMLKEEPNA